MKNYSNINLAIIYEFADAFAGFNGISLVKRDKEKVVGRDEIPPHFMTLSHFLLNSIV